MMDLIVSWLCSAIAEAFEEAVTFFSSLFGYDVTQFNMVFPYAANAYDVIRKVSLALALFIAGWQIITFFMKGSEASTTPIRAALNALIAVAFIFYGNYLFEAVLDFCQYPYDALNAIDGTEWGVLGWDSIGDVIVGSISSVFSTTSMLLYLIILILIVFSFIKLLLEIVERYVITFVLLYLSPLASATLASSTTNGIYKKYIAMFFSQCLLLFLNVWCLRMACSGLSLSGYEGVVPVIPFIMCYAFLRISARMDSYVNQLGLNAAITGNGLGAEIMATGAALMKSGSGGSSGGGGNKVLGGIQKASQYLGKVDPAAAMSQRFQNATRAGFQSMRENPEAGWRGALRVAKDAGRNPNDFFGNMKNAVSPHKVTDQLNGQLVHGATDNATEDGNLRAWSSSEKLAHGSFSYMASGPTEPSASGHGFEDSVVDDSNRVTAIAKGLGVDNQSKEAAGFIRAGFGQEDGATNLSYQLDKTGLHAQYDKDGFRNKLTLHNPTQYNNLSRPKQEGFQKFNLSDGKAYYLRTSRTKLDPPGCDT